MERDAAARVAEILGAASIELGMEADLVGRCVSVPAVVQHWPAPAHRRHRTYPYREQYASLIHDAGDAHAAGMLRLGEK